MKQYLLNRSINQPWYALFISFYTTLICIVFAFNLMILLAVHLPSRKRPNGGNIPRRPQSHNNGETRNVLISHLSIFDIFLSSTMPWTAINALTKFWPFGRETELMCRLTKSASAFVVYSTSMLIILIAVNSYRQIVRPLDTQLSPQIVCRITPVLLIIALIMTLPMCYHTQFLTVDELLQQAGKNDDITPTTTTISGFMQLTTESSFSLNMASTLGPDNPILGPNISRLGPNGSTPYLKSEDFMDDNNASVLPTPQYQSGVTICGITIEDNPPIDWANIVFCVENWGFQKPTHRFYYSLFSLTTQYIVPLFIISILYLRVYLKLRKQSASRLRVINVADEERRQRENERSKRRNRILATVSLVFCFCWFPLNLINLLVDGYKDLLGDNTELVTIVFMICHLVGMSSACINPFIYGYCDETIRSGKLCHAK